MRRATTASLTLPFSTWAAILHKPVMPSISDGGACIIKLSLPSLSERGLEGGLATVGAVADVPTPPVIAVLPVSMG